MTAWSEGFEVARQAVGDDVLRVRTGARVAHRLALDQPQAVTTLALWQAQCAGRVTPLKLPCGHFIPEERPPETAQALRDFLR